MTAAWLDRALFKSPVYYAAAFTERDFHRELRRLELAREKWPSFIVSDRSDATTHFIEFRGRCCAIVCMHPAPERDPVEVVGLLVHEAAHIWQRVRECIGESEPSHEFEAYSMQWLSQQLVAAYRDFIARRTKHAA